MPTSISPRVILAALCLPLLTNPLADAQATVHVSTPAARFAPPPKSKADDVAGGRRFRGAAFETVVLTGTLQMPSSKPSIYKIHRLVVHFRTSPQGPSLRGVELRNGSNVEFNIDTNLRGDYTAKSIAKPKETANLWDFGDIPIKVDARTTVRLKVVFPGGFEGLANPGDFILTSVDADFEPPK